MIQQCLTEILAGRAGPEQLVEAVEQARLELRALRTGFRRQVQELPDPVRASVATEIEAVETSLEDYFRVLQACEGYLEGFSREVLQSCLLQLPAAISRLNLDFLRFRETASAERGPTTHPGINRLFALARSAPEQLEAEVEMELAACLRAQAAATADEILGAPRHEFLEGYVACLESFTPSQPWLSELLSLGEDYARIDSAFVARRFSQKPTPMPVLNLVANSAWLVSQQRLDARVCQSFMEQAAGLLEQGLRRHQQLLNEYPSGPARRVGEELSSSTLDALQVLEAYGAWLEQPDPQALSRLVEGLQLVASSLAELHAQLEQLEAGSGLCPGCGARLDGSLCGSCGVRSAGPSLEYSRVERVLEAAERALVGDLEDLDRQLEDLDGSLARANQAALQSPTESLRHRYLLALEHFSEGLDLLHELTSVNQLQRARQVLLEAAEQLHQVRTEIESLGAAPGTP